MLCSTTPVWTSSHASKDDSDEQIRHGAAFSIESSIKALPGPEKREQAVVQTRLSSRWSRDSELHLAQLEGDIRQ